jgi:hypothetical protein
MTLSVNPQSDCKRESHPRARGRFDTDNISVEEHCGEEHASLFTSRMPGLHLRKNNRKCFPGALAPSAFRALAGETI